MSAPCYRFHWNGALRKLKPAATCSRCGRALADEPGYIARSTRDRDNRFERALLCVTCGLDLTTPRRKPS